MSKTKEAGINKELFWHAPGAVKKQDYPGQTKEDIIYRLKNEYSKEQVRIIQDMIERTLDNISVTDNLSCIVVRLHNYKNVNCYKLFLHQEYYDRALCPIIVGTELHFNLEAPF